MRIRGKIRHALSRENIHTNIKLNRTEREREKNRGEKSGNTHQHM